MCEEMKDDYSDCEFVTPPWINELGRRVSIGLAYEHIDYFKKIGEEYGLSAERVMAMYLRHIVYTGYKVNIDMPKVAETVGDSL